MTFKLQPDPTFWATVDLSVPGEEQRKPVRFEFAHCSRQRWLEVTEEGKATVRAVVLKITRNWAIEGEQFTAEKLESMLDNYLPAAVEMYEKYVQEAQESKRKN